EGKRPDFGARRRAPSDGWGDRRATRRVSRPRPQPAARRRSGREKRSPPRDGVRHRRARRDGPDGHSRRRRRGRLLPRVLYRARVAARVKADKLYLVGFMGAGKTSVARALGRRMGWRVEDIDHRIEAREHLRVAEIFTRHGEPYFRSVERSVLEELLPQRHVIVATGGGT